MEIPKGLIAKKARALLPEHVWTDLTDLTEVERHRVALIFLRQEMEKVIALSEAEPQPDNPEYAAEIDKAKKVCDYVDLLNTDPATYEMQ
jgi:hypothetical protein